MPEGIRPIKAPDPVYFGFAGESSITEQGKPLEGIDECKPFTKDDIKRIMRDSVKRRDGRVDPVRDREMIQDTAVFFGESFEAAQQRLQRAIDGFVDNL